MTVTIEHPDLTLHRVCQAGTLRLFNYLMSLFQLGNDGCENPNSVLTSGAPSFHVTGEAFDLAANFLDPAQRARGNNAFNWLYNYRDQLNLQQIIFGDRIWSSFDQEIKNYSHQDHNNHVHTSLGRNAALNWNLNWIHGTNPPVPPPKNPDAPVPKPQLAVEDKGANGVFYYNKFMHDCWLDSKGDVQHIFNPGQIENLSNRLRKTGIVLGPMQVGSPVTFAVRPDSYGLAIDGFTVAKDTFWICHWEFKGDGKGGLTWFVTPYPPA